MKPRNKFEKAVIAQSDNLRPLPTAPRRWAFRNTIEHYAYRLPKGRITCMDCGHSWIMDNPSEKCTCPKCQATLKVAETYSRTLQQKSYLNVLTTSGKFQVLRIFLQVVEMRKGFKAKPAFLEIGQYWMDASGKVTIVGLKRTIGWYLDSFAFGSPMEIRKDDKNVFGHLSNQHLYPSFRLIPEIKRNGFDGDFHGCEPIDFLSTLLSTPQAETLLKSRDIQALKYLMAHKSDVIHFWRSYSIAKRHGYEIPDFGTWIDYLKMLERFGKDTHSPKLIAPANLFDAHDEYVEKVSRQRIKEQREKDRQKAIADDAKFKELKGGFIGLSFTDNEIEIKTLDSVDEYYVEGDTQHICVASSQYYLKKDTLVFSARINGRRIATVEISLKTLNVIQCRAACNKVSEYQDRIEGIIKCHRKEIRERMRA